MVAREKTEVLYDTSQATKELKKLDKQVQKSGGTAKKSFGDDASAGLKKFGDSALASSGKVGGLVKTVTRLGASGGAIAAGFAVAAGAIVETVSSVLGLSSALRDVNAGLETINATAERTLQFRELASSVVDADLNRQQVETQRLLRIQAAQIQLRQNELKAAQDLARESVFARQAEFDAIDAAFQRSLNRRLSAEQRLEQKRSELSAGTLVDPSKTTGGQVVDLAARAQQEAQRGNVDLAEQLINKAEQLSDELGNHVFFTNKIEDANRAVLQALEDEVQEAKSEEDQLAAQREQLQGRVDDAKEFESALARELELMNRQRRALRANRQIIQDTAKELRDAQTLATGQRRVSAGITQISRISESVGAQGGEGQFFDAIKRLTTGILETGRGRAGTLRPGTEAVENIAGAVSETLDRAFADAEITPREAAELSERIAGVSDALGILEAGIEEGELTGALSSEAKRIRSLSQGIQNIARGAAEFRTGGGGFDEGITPQATVAAEARVERIIEQRNVQQDITLNINGSVIDEDTLKQLTERLKRELRKGTIEN